MQLSRVRGIPMKNKLLTIVGLVILFQLTGCASSSALETTVEELKSKISQLSTEVSDMKSEHSDIAAQAKSAAASAQRKADAAADAASRANERIDNIAASYKK